MEPCDQTAAPWLLEREPSALWQFLDRFQVRETHSLLLAISFLCRFMFHGGSWWWAAGFRLLVFGDWCLVAGVWWLAFGGWCLVDGICGWCLVAGAWLLAFGGLCSVAGAW